MRLISIICFILCVATLKLSLASERIFHEDCEATSYNEHFMERTYGTGALSYWNEIKSDINRSTNTPYGGNNCLTYDPFTTGNPHAVVGYGGAIYGNTSNFDLSSHNSRYWYFRWYQRWETGISWTGSVENKLIYINYRDGGDFTFIVHKNGAASFHIYAKDRATYSLIFNSYNRFSGGSVDDMEWHKLELYIDAGTTGGGNGEYWFKVDDTTVGSRTNIRFNPTIHANPIHWLTGWPSNISGDPSGTCRTWLDDLEIYTLSGPNDMPGSEPQPNDSPPTIEVLSPTLQDTFVSPDQTMGLGGNSSDDNGINSITWANNRGGQGTANDSGDWSEWSISNIALQEGENVITVTAMDSAGQTSSDSLTVTYSFGVTDNSPTIFITSPTSESTSVSGEELINLAGNASDDNEITSLTWAINSVDQGTVEGDWTSWSIPDIFLEEDENVIAVTATDSVGQRSTDTITVTCSDTHSDGDTLQAWSAVEQTGDTTWSDSGVTWCVRLLVQGDQITQSGGLVRLGLQGRGSGNYAIRKVSIAERDVNGSEGDVTDSTWRQVTFSGNSEGSWASDVITVNAGEEKMSDPIGFSLQAGKDYYVTYLLETPSVYLVAPSGYRELYFEGTDHTDDVDWSGNGHRIYNARFHAAASIYVVSSDEPVAPTGLHVVGQQ